MSDILRLIAPGPTLNVEIIRTTPQAEAYRTSETILSISFADVLQGH